MNIIIRGYEKTDYPQLIYLLNVIYQSDIDQATLERYYLNKGQDIIVAVDLTTKQLVGCAFTEVREDYVRCKKTMFVSYVAVLEEFRRYGIGKMMFNEIETKCKKEKCVAIELTSANYRVNAHAFYQALGFTKKETTVFIKELSE